MPWPEEGDLTDLSITVADMRTGLDNWLHWCRRNIGGHVSQSALIIDGSNTISGVVDPVHYVAASGVSDLYKITDPRPTEHGVFLVLLAMPGQTITIHHFSGTGTGKIYLEGGTGSTFELSDQKAIMLCKIGDHWWEMSRSWGDDVSGFANHIGALSADNTALTGTTTAETLQISGTTAGSLEVGTDGTPLRFGAGIIRVETGTLYIRGNAGTIKAYMSQGIDGNSYSDYSQIITERDTGPGHALDADTVDGYEATELMDPGYVLVRQFAPSGTGGGAVGTGNDNTWLYVQFNDVPVDTTGTAVGFDGTYTHCVGIPAGEWLIYGRAPAFRVGHHRARLIISPDVSVSYQYGTCGRNITDQSVQTWAEVIGYLDVGSTTLVGMQAIHASEDNGGDTSYERGYPGGFGVTDEYYAEMEFIKIGP